MAWQYSPLLLTTLAAAVVLFVLSLYTLVRIATHGMRPTFALLAIWNAAGAHWALTYTIQLSNTLPQDKLLWFVLQSPARYILTLGWFAIVAYAVNRREWLARKRFAPIASLAIVAIFLHVANPVVPLLWTDLGVATVGDFAVLDVTFTPLYFLLAIWFPIGVAVGGIVLFASEIHSSDAVDLVQALLIGSSVLFPIMTTLAEMSGALGDLIVNPTPVALIGTGATLSYAVYRSAVFGTVPIAKTTLVETMAEGVLVLGENDRISDANVAASEMFDEPTLQDQDASDVLPGLAGRLDHYDVDEQFRYTTTMASADGGEQYLRINVSPVGGENAAGRLALIEDVTEQRRIEQRYQALIEGISDVITLLDEDGMVTYVSGSVSRILGRSSATVIANDGVEFLVQENEATARASLERAIDSPASTTRFEHTMVDDDGKEHVFEAVARNMVDDPNVEGIIVVSRDITARKQRERELAAMNERLEQFAGILSHDLRNPLEVAEIHLTLAERGNEEALETVSDAHDRIDEMIDDVLTLVRDAGDVTREPVALDQLARAAWSNVATADVTLDLADPPAILADRQRTVQVFENLYRNAVEHAKVDGESLTVTVGALPDGFYVEDDGTGIPAEDRDGVFEHGYTTASEGTGLGLAIVRQVADDHGWSVTAEAGSSGGARFAFRNVARAPADDGDDGTGQPDESGETDEPSDERDVPASDRGSNSR